MRQTRNLSFGALAAALLLTVFPASRAQATRADVVYTPPVTIARAASAPVAERRGYMKMLKQLGLTPSQKAELKALMNSKKSRLQAIKNNAALTDQQKRRQMRQVRQSTMIQVRADLTPVQTQSLNTYLAQRKAARTSARSDVSP